jgi:hypothetical protein
MRLVVLALTFSAFAFAQTTSTTPDCQFFSSFTGNQTGASFAAASTATGTPCIKWRVSWETSSATAYSAFNVNLEGAPNTATGAGTFVLWTGAGTAEVGTNPGTTATNGTFVVGPGTAAQGIYYPWVHIKITGAMGTGTISVKVLGYRGTSPAAPGSAGTTANVNLAQVNGHTTQEAGQNGTLSVGGTVASGAALSGANNPVPVGGSDFGGTAKLEVQKIDALGNNYQFSGCASSVEATLSGTSYNTVIALSGTTVIRVCKVFVTSASMGTPNVNTFTIAAGADCTMSPTELLNAPGITGMDSDFGGSLRGAAGAALCFKESVGNGDKVTITYTQGTF